MARERHAVCQVGPRLHSPLPLVTLSNVEPSVLSYSRPDSHYGP